MLDIATLKELNDRASDTRARTAIRRIVKADGGSSCCRAEKKVTGRTTLSYVCQKCGEPCD